MLINSSMKTGGASPSPTADPGSPRWRRGAAVEISLCRRALREAPLREVRSVGAWVQQLKFGCAARADDIRPYAGRGDRGRRELCERLGACRTGRRGRWPIRVLQYVDARVRRLRSVCAAGRFMKRPYVGADWIRRSAAVRLACTARAAEGVGPYHLRLS